MLLKSNSTILLKVICFDFHTAVVYLRVPHAHKIVLDFFFFLSIADHLCVYLILTCIQDSLLCQSA